MRKCLKCKRDLEESKFNLIKICKKCKIGYQTGEFEMGKLLEQAKLVPVHKSKEFKFTDDDYELVEAWLKGEISLRQIQVTKKFKSATYCYSYIALASREIMSENGIRTKKGK